MRGEAKQWLELRKRNLGDTFEALIDRCARAPRFAAAFGRLHGETRVEMGDGKNASATITCYFQQPIGNITIHDMRLMWECLGPPSHMAPGHSISWHFGAPTHEPRYGRPASFSIVDTAPDKAPAP